MCKIIDVETMIHIVSNINRFYIDEITMNELNP